MNAKNTTQEVVNCATCGCRIDATEWHVATARRGDESEVRILSFCCQQCETAYEND